MTIVTLEVVLEGDIEDQAGMFDDLVCEGLNKLGIYPSSVLIDSIEGN